MNQENALGELIRACDVCGIPLEDIPDMITREEEGKLQTFCSDKCYKEYLENPELYGDFSEEEVAE